MDFLHIIILALVQGFTEFLPISSSAHLILVPTLLGWADQGLVFDVATHFGTLIAVLWYFRHDLRPLFNDWLISIKTKQTSGNSVLAWGILIGTIPAGLAGLAINDYYEHLRNPLIIASSTLVFGFLLWFADYRAQQQLNHHIPQKTEQQLTVKMILIIGCAQAIALIPGTSRSGITITAALLTGMSRTAAARFSFLLSIPIIIIASTMKAIEFTNTTTHIPWLDILAGIGLSAISAYICIHYFIKLLNTMGLLPFIIYRLFLGIFLFWVFW